jgi:hypothetical protein
MATPRLNLFQGSEVDAARQIIRGLPALPSIIRYLDEYDDSVRSVRISDDKWLLTYDTTALLIMRTRGGESVLTVAQSGGLFVTSIPSSRR